MWSILSYSAPYWIKNKWDCASAHETYKMNVALMWDLLAQRIDNLKTSIDFEIEIEKLYCNKFKQLYWFSM